jgi:ABC-2 type transport system ATP-binding protein
VIFSSHQLDLVERLCDRVGIVVRGHMQECGTVDELRAGGGTQLVVHAPQAPLGWADGLPGVRTSHHGEGRTVLDVERGSEHVVDQAVLAAALRTGPVHEFSRRQPSLTERFRAVVAA